MYLTFAKTKVGPTMNTFEFINYELHFDSSYPYTPIEEEIIGMLNEIDVAVDSEPIKEVDNVQIGDVLVDRIRFEDDDSALATLKQFLEQIPIVVPPRIQSN